MTPMILPGPYSNLSARIDVPTSKSLTNRALVAAAVAGGGEILNPLDCEDTRLLSQALSDAGWAVEWTDRIRVGRRRALEGEPTVWLGNSGTGARLVLGLFAASPGRVVVDGTPRLRQRPMQPLIEALRRLGARVEGQDEGLPAFVEGVLMEGGRVTIRPQVSSQFVSSLLMAGPLMRNGLDLEAEGELPSRPYVDLTLDMLADFGVTVEQAPDRRRWRVPPGPATPATVSIEGDWSGAAFLAAAVAVAGGEVAVAPLAIDSRQGDRAVVDILKPAGVDVQVDGDAVVFRGPARHPFKADLRNTPDLFPALVVVATAVQPGSELAGLDHLKHKESDRLSVMIANLERLGSQFERRDSSLRVMRGLDRGSELVPEVTAADDHRIAMAMAVAALAAGPLELDDPDCVAKSFPDFWSMWHRLLGQTEGGVQPV
jgi:3-phosphoshikimate 1-carboxyvinyltransferase